MIPARRFTDRHPFSRAFVAAIIMAVAVIIPDYKAMENWATALGIIAAAVSGGVTKGGQNSH